MCLTNTPNDGNTTSAQTMEMALNMNGYAVIVEALTTEEGGGFVATVPDLPGCMSDGETPQEALQNVQDAIREWIEAAKDLGHPVPTPISALR